MTKFIRKSVTGLALLSTLGAVVAVTPAEAQRSRGHNGGHYYGHRGNGNGTALAVGGLIGLGIGASLANRGGYYDRGYGGGYYGEPYYRAGYYRHCVSRLRWDPYIGDYVRVRYC